MKRKPITLVLALILLVSSPLPVAAGVPYLGYNYNHWSDPVPSPVAYVPVLNLTALDIDPGIGHFDRPQDIFVDINDHIYVLDTGNNRIVVFDKNFSLIKIIDSFQLDGQTETFNSPNGIFVTDSLNIHIADTNNMRIVTLDKDGLLLNINDGPDYGEIEDDFTFFPMKVVVDRAGREYAIVRGVYEGIMRFNTEGRFTGYFGTVRVSVNPIDWLWRRLSTSAQRARQQLFIPTEFSGMDIDEYGFIYTTNIEVSNENKVKRLNPGGEDVLLNLSEQVINGDQNYRLQGFGPLSGPSVFVDIVSRGSGMYSALDSTRGRLFTYDSEGNMLYVIGGMGNILGMNRRPVAVEVLNDYIIILDQQRGDMVFYEPSEYGRLINEALILRFEGDESGAVEMWHRVLEFNPNYPLALVGIGKAYLASGDNQAAMHYLRQGVNIEQYSLAFRRHRTEVLKENINVILSVFALLFFIRPGIFIYKKIKHINKGGQQL